MRSISSLLPFLVLVAACNQETADEAQSEEGEDSVAEALTAPGPDLVVSAVTSPYAGGASVTVCNRGTVDSGPTSADLRLSSNTTIDAADPTIGTVWVRPLRAGECEAFSTSTMPPPPLPDGGYYLGAIVDPQSQVVESNENNNTRVGPLQAIGNGPDLVVTAATAPASANGPFTVAATVCNNGNQFAGGSEVAVRLSTDTTITSADPLVGTGYVALPPGQCGTVNVAANAPYPPGTYHVGIVADPGNTVRELIETNNTFAGKLIAVGNGPDLHVSSVTGPATAASGEPFTTKATVCNQGTQPSSGAAVEIRLSADTTIDQADLLGGNGYVHPLMPGQCTSTEIPTTANVPAGTWRLGARVEASPGELVTTNNTYGSRIIGIGRGPDLAITALAAPSTLAGGSFTATATVCNQGNEPVGGIPVELRLSGDTTISATDMPAGSASVPWLLPGQCRAVAITGNAPSFPQGTYYLAAVADPTNGVAEILETNNTSPLKQVGLGWGPDLVVTALSGPTAIAGGGAPFAGSATVCNQGNASVYGSELQIVLSADTTISTTDAILTTAPVPSLDAGACTQIALGPQAWFQPPPEGGPMYLGAVIDPRNVVRELLETNNGFTGKLTGIGRGPDFTISSVTAPASAQYQFTTTVNVCNVGTEPGATDVLVVSSLDSAVSSGDDFAGQAPTPVLEPGACSSLAIPTSPTGPRDRAIYIGAVADPRGNTRELIETNNVGPSRLVGYGFGVDLVVSTFTVPATLPRFGATATAKVCNQGTMATYGGTAVELRWSTGTTAGVSDPRLGYATVPQLAAGACSTLSLSADGLPYGMTVALAAVVDPMNGIPELIETNNVSASRRVSVAP